MTREELQRAFREVAEMEFADIPSEEEINISFSSKFTTKMEKLIMRQKKALWNYVNTLQKRVAIVVLIMFSFVVITCANEEIRASMLQWCKEVYNEYTYYYFKGDTTKEITYKYQLTMIPEGFEVVDEIDEKNWRVMRYENKEGSIIVFEQNITEDYDYTMDNERLEWSTAIINGKKVELYVDGISKGAVWIEDGYFMSLYVSRCEDIEIIKEMICSIQ